MVFYETPVFIKLIDKFLSDDERFALLNTLLKNPDSGDLVPRGGGIRKVRFALKGKGKSGGLRVVYAWSKTREQIIFFVAFPKSEKSDLTQDEIKMFAKEAKLWL